MQAQIAYSQASAVDKDMASYTGLIETFLTLNKLKDAAMAARDAHASMPRCSTACILMGRILNKSPQGAPEVCTSD